MRKLSLLVFYKDYQGFLEELRERGVVHIYEDKEQAAEDETLQAKLRLVKRVNEMIRLLENRGVKEEKEKQRSWMRIYLLIWKNNIGGKTR
ncbi:MAG: hypothetical protein ACLTXP_16940 [Odoribacter splanchnicus]